MKFWKIGIVAVVCILIFSSMSQLQQTALSERSLRQFRSASKEFAIAAGELKHAVAAIDEQAASREAAIQALRTCRLRYKRVEYYMEYFFQYPVNLYNRAPVYEVEEPFMEYQSPVGLQVIEEMLMDTAAYRQKKEILDQCEVIYSSATDIPSLLYNFSVNDGQMMESARLEIIRVITLGITGYDAPKLKSGITESAMALDAVREVLQPLLREKQGGDSVLYYLGQSIAQLEGYPEFDNFDRLGFLITAALPLQKHLGKFIREHDLDLNTYTALNHDADHLFSRDAIDVKQLSQRDDRVDEVALIKLGKQLFFENALSGNGMRSCATCHKPELYFTDGLVKSKTLDGKSVVKRNAPSLLYAAYQRSQFHDGRATSLEEQIKIVLRNPLEMDADPEKVVQYLNTNEGYSSLFGQAFPDAGGKITIGQVGVALAAYEQTLAPFNSAFDRYMNGDMQALNTAQKQGFNLFMGKAMCGTCHFAPVFNGMLPPYYEVSEVEVLGVPQNNNLRRPKADTDSGRYHFFPISFNSGAFKTSTVRNTAVTAPYMHNGVFKSLREVIRFYDKGGGNGIGMNIETQTLSDEPLKLTKKEMDKLVYFLESLTDKL